MSDSTNGSSTARRSGRSHRWRRWRRRTSTSSCSGRLRRRLQRVQLHGFDRTLEAARPREDSGGDSRRRHRPDSDRPPDDDPLTYAYLKALGRRIGVEMSVNTSFNVAGPIAQTPRRRSTRCVAPGVSTRCCWWPTMAWCTPPGTTASVTADGLRDGFGVEGTV